MSENIEHRDADRTAHEHALAQANPITNIHTSIHT
jgi:hypothetical protein